MIKKLLVSSFIAGLFSTAPALAAFDSDEEAIRAVLGDKEVISDWFAPSFLNAVPYAQIREITAQVRETIGAVAEIRKTGDGYEVVTASHEMAVQIVLDGEGAIAGLLFKAAAPVGQSIKEAAAAVTALPGETALLITRNGETVLAHNAEADTLAVGSAFKLGILKGVADKIAAGEAQWDDVITLESDQISLPGGTLQILPPGSPVTLHTLSALMIAISDNTATDALLDYVGRQRVAEILGTKSVIKTREMFMMKADAELRERYLAADADLEAHYEEMAQRPLPTAAAAGTPHTKGIEWYIPLTRLCAILASLRDEEIPGYNPGVAKPDDWARIAFKGGSEIGVLNLTSEVEDNNGDYWCVAMTWNGDKALDEPRGASAYAGVLSAIKAEAARASE